MTFLTLLSSISIYFSPGFALGALADELTPAVFPGFPGGGTDMGGFFCRLLLAIYCNTSDFNSFCPRPVAVMLEALIWYTSSKARTAGPKLPDLKYENYES